MKIMSLPLMPTRFIKTGLERIKCEASIDLRYDKTLLQIFTKVFTYFEEFWIKRVGVENLSIYGFFENTNNHSEGFNKLLNKFMGNKHLNIWEFSGKLDVSSHIAFCFYYKVGKKYIITY